MDLFHDVNIYAGADGYVMSVSKLELIKSNLFKNILSCLNICDGCSEPLKIIFPDEDRDVVFAAFSEVTWKPGLTIIRDNRYKSLLRRLGFYSALGDGNNSSTTIDIQTTVDDNSSQQQSAHSDENICSELPSTQNSERFSINEPASIQSDSDFSIEDKEQEKTESVDDDVQISSVRSLTRRREIRKGPHENVKDRYRVCPHCKETFYFTGHTRHVKSCKFRLNKYENTLSLAISWF